MSHRSLLASSLGFGLVATAVVVGCSANGLSDPLDLASSPSGNEPGAVLPPASEPAGDGSSSATPPPPPPPHADAGPIDAGPAAPAEGASCAVPDEIFTRACGACGKQEALCQFADADAGAGKVSAYGACHDEVGECVPGTVVEESCGNCGTHTKTCSKYCGWSTSACKGEPVNACPAGMIAWTTAGCARAGTFRQRSCEAACKWGDFTAACTAPDFAVSVPATAGATASITLPLSAAFQGKRVTGACGPNATLSPTADHVVAYVRVDNTTGKEATLSAWNEQAPGGATIDTVLAAYAAVPQTDDALKACDKTAVDYCPTGLPCGASVFGGLTGANAVVVPAGASRIVAITTHESSGTPGKITEGDVILRVRTDALH